MTLAAGGSDATGATAAAAAARTWAYLADALRLQDDDRGRRRRPRARTRPGAPALSAPGRPPFGAVGEVHPDVVAAYGLRQRVGYLTLSVDALLAQPRRPLTRPGR